MDTKTKECCDKCESLLPGLNGKNYCQNSFCPCHNSQQSEDIRGAIVEMTSTMLDNPKGNIYPTTKFYNRMESFINNLLEAEREKVGNAAIKYMSNTPPFKRGYEAAYSEIESVIEGMKLKSAQSDYESTKTNIEKAGYTQALTDLSSKLQEKKNSI